MSRAQARTSGVGSASSQYIALHYIILPRHEVGQGNSLHYITLHYIALYYVTLHYITSA